jgi:hypothetical protein
MRNLGLGFLVSIGFVLGACAGPSDSPGTAGGNQGSQQYSYEYCYNCTEGTGLNARCATTCSYGGCTTGRKQANSKTEYCSLLRNDEANRYCAEDMRKEAFDRAGCSGTF